MKSKIGALMPVFYAILVSISSMSNSAESSLPTAGILENSQCIECHEKSESHLIDSWRSSGHAKTEPVADCVACHGNKHVGAAEHARRDDACLECHGGKRDPVVHSYSTSKHGALMQIESKHMDWTQPLSMANYRVPGCSYCHMHAGNHDVSAGVRHDLMVDKASEYEAVHDRVRAVCQDCHSPRYITRLLENGESMLEIARKKVREAESLIDQATVKFTEEELMPVKRQIVKMQQHLTNVYLGAGHQSPDYQWWHGQPALDGDLLRIKGALGELYRPSVMGNSKDRIER